MSSSPNIFSGLKVLDIASFIAGPAATTILSDYGADVIKVEPPGLGDPQRLFHLAPPNPTSPVNYAWELENRNKRAIVLDLKSPDAVEILHRLVRWADVLVTNYPPKVRQALGLTYEALTALNPRLIYADVTGYGAAGPEADKPGFDITAFWARSGLMDVIHDAASAPTLPVPGIGDHATATALYASIVTALYVRERTGKGGHATTSLIAQGVWAAGSWVEGALHGARFYGQHEREAPPSALVNPYRTSDGRWILPCVLQPKDWPGFAAAIDRPDLLQDPRFADVSARVTNSAALVEILDALFVTETLAHWREKLDAARVTFGVVQTMDEVVNDPQMLINEVLLPLAEPNGTATHTVNSPVQVVGFTKVPPRRAPRLGQHTDEILSELGFDDAARARLHDIRTVVAASD
ncbi:MAG: L-carnitine dehydratase/bile acid-inducible protein [Caulobacteraceae bacterium]|nr:L-carnitine dehydratase/bile acid-inducible protein [Caulobacteraceae bacterium]